MSQKIFQELNLRDNVSRNGFSLGHPLKFSAQVGELLPIFHRTIMPGDKFTCRVSHFTRTSDVQTAAYTQIKEYFDWFFVPYRILQRDLPQILAQDTRNPQIATSVLASKQIGSKIPCINLVNIYGIDGSSGVVGRLMQEKNQFGFNRGYKSAKLLSYLGYGQVTSSQLKKIENAELSSIGEIFNSGSYECSLLPLAAYQAIFYNWFRNTQWETNQPQNYNFDWATAGNYKWHVNFDEYPSFWSNPTMFDLQYVNYPKDLFFGVLPNSQMGDDAEVSILGTASFGQRTGYIPVGSFESQSEQVSQQVQLTGNVGSSGANNYQVHDVTNQDLSNDYLGIAKNDLPTAQFNSAFSILELRKSEAMQKYREILGTGENNYKSILEKLFNVDVSDKLINIPYYLGGSSSEINISEVENTNLTGSNQVVLRGKGIGSSNGDTITFESKDEYGILMCVYHAQPVIDYKLNNLHFDITKTDADDYALPIFDSLGLVELPLTHVDISAGLNLDNRMTHLGYTIRNYDYKTAVSRSLGAFRETELQTWYSPIDFDYLKDYVLNNYWSGLNSSFFKVNPHIVDDIFVLDAGDEVFTDQLRIKATFDISAVRPLSRYGVPYAK